MTFTVRRMRSLVPLAVLGLMAQGCGAPSRSSSQEGDTAAPIAVRTAVVAETEITDTFEAGGVVESRTAAVVAARVMAPIAAVRTTAGERVRAGQVLVELDGRDLTAGARSAAAAATETRDGAAAAEADARAAEAALALARATHGRIAGLHAKGSATAQELDEATAALAAGEARAAGATARARQSQAAIERAAAASEAATATAAFLRVTAPFDGLVTETLVEPGSMAIPGLPLVRLEDPRSYRLKVRLDESRIRQVRPGAPIDVQMDGPDGQPTNVAGTVVEVSRAVDAGSRSFLVEIDLDGAPGLRAGAFGRARIPGAVRRGLSVPAEALVRQGQVTSVFVVDGPVARLRLVRVAGTEVLAGLTAGESVVLAPPPDLTDGRSIAGGPR